MDQYHHGNLRPALLKAAFQLVGKLGLEGLTLREVARRAGVSHNAPYRHFKSKEELVAALATDAFEHLHKDLKKASEVEGNPSEKLGAAARAYLKFALQNPERFGLMFHSTFDRKAFPEYVAAYSASLALLSELLKSCAVQNSLEEIADAEDLIWASIHGICELGIAQRLREGDSAELEYLADRAVKSLLAGLGTAAH